MPRASWLCLPLVALFSLAAPPRAEAQNEMTKFRNRETAMWESVKHKEIESIRKVFAPAYIAVYDMGIMSLADELDGISKVTLRSYGLSDVKVQRIDGLNVLVAYKAVVDGDMEGKSISGTYNTLTLWHRSGNQWSVAAHSEVKAP